MNNTQLYLEDTLIELDEAVHFAITKTFEDIENPTVMINDWSKSVDIPGTQSNNQFFGHIYNPDMQIVSSSSGTYINFDPTRKLDMKLIYNGQLLMKGYAKITQIKKSKGKIYYSCTLNGQLGKIFQDFANIRFDRPTDTSTSEDLEFIIDTSQFFVEVMDCSHMNNIWMHDLVQRGVYDTSDNINPYLKSYDIINFTPNNAFVDDFEYDTYQLNHNQALKFVDTLSASQPSLVSQIPADTIYPDGLKPREIGEYRTYNNLPFVYFNKLFEIVAHKAFELSGYRFWLDENWFRIENPYWYKSVVYLQPLNYHNHDIEDDSKTNTYNKADAYLLMTGDSSAAYRNIYNSSISVRRSDGYNEEVIGIADWDGQGKAYNFFTSNLNSLVSVNFEVYISVADLQAEELHFYYDTGLDIDINIRDDQGNIVKTCKALATSHVSTIDLSPYEYVFKVDRWENYLSVHQFRLILPFTVVFAVNSITYGTKFSVDMKCNWHIDPLSPGGTVYRDTPLFYDSRGADEFYTNNYFYVSSGKPMVIKFQNMIRSGAQYKLSDLWDYTVRPWDIILNYMKIFRMMIYVDDVNHVIKFTPAREFFKTHSVEDWSNKLDTTKDFIVKPVYWGANKVLFNLEDNETKLGKGYKEKYGINFGEKQIITDYKFDTNVKKLFDKPIKNTIITTDNVLSWNTTDHIGAITYTRSSSEVFPNFQDEDGKLVNPFGSFAFALGNAMWDTGGNLRQPILSDDTVNQLLQNKFYYSQSADNQCYMTSNGYQKVDIAKWRNIFTLGKPMENYSLTDYNANNAKDLYTAFWENYINERYNIQNKMVTCYLDIKPIDFLNFRFNKFIKIENQLYFVNKIYDYDIMSSATTKCDLITVRNIENYYIDQFEFIDGHVQRTVLSVGDVTGYTVNTNRNGVWAIESPGVFDIIPPSGTGPGSGTITVNQGAQPGDYNIIIYRSDSPFPSMADKEHVTITITVTE